MIEQLIVKRKIDLVDHGIMGFSDWTEEKEKLSEFIERVSDSANEINGQIINISYPNEDIAFIVYKTY